MKVAFPPSQTHCAALNIDSQLCPIPILSSVSSLSLFLPSYDTHSSFTPIIVLLVPSIDTEYTTEEPSSSPFVYREYLPNETTTPSLSPNLKSCPCNCLSLPPLTTLVNHELIEKLTQPLSCFLTPSSNIVPPGVCFNYTPDLACAFPSFMCRIRTTTRRHPLDTHEFASPYSLDWRNPPQSPEALGHKCHPRFTS